MRSNLIAMLLVLCAHCVSRGQQGSAAPAPATAIRAEVARTYVAAYLDWQEAQRFRARGSAPGRDPVAGEELSGPRAVNVASMLVTAVDTITLATDSLFVFSVSLIQFHGGKFVVGVTRRLEIFPLFGLENTMVGEVVARYSGPPDSIDLSVARTIVRRELAFRRREIGVKIVAGRAPESSVPSSLKGKLTLWTVSLEDELPVGLHLFTREGDDVVYTSISLR